MSAPSRGYPRPVSMTVMEPHYETHYKHTASGAHYYAQCCSKNPSVPWSPLPRLGNLLLTGLSELEAIFDVEGTTYSSSDEEDVEKVSPGSCASQEQRSEDPMSEQALLAEHVRRAFPQQYGRSSPRWTLSSTAMVAGLRLNCLVWCTILGFAANQGFEDISPFLFFPLCLPPLFCICALSLLHSPRPAARRYLVILSKLYRAHILLQAGVLATIWHIWKDTVIYRVAGATYASEDGSLRHLITFGLATMAQAALPVLAFLGSQWSIAVALAFADITTSRAADTAARDRDVLPTCSRSSSISEATPEHSVSLQALTSSRVSEPSSRLPRTARRCRSLSSSAVGTASAGGEWTRLMKDSYATDAVLDTEPSADLTSVGGTSASAYSL